ncbi:MAG: AsmA-like C-terminal region-containing protein [Candidatus Sumerlaeaceae bacterium]
MVALAAMLVSCESLPADAASRKYASNKASVRKGSSVPVHGVPSRIALPYQIPENPEPVPGAETYSAAADQSASSTPTNYTGGLHIPIKKPRIVGRISNNKPVVTGLSGEFANGQVGLDGEINLANPEGTHRANVHFQGVCLAGVLQILGINVQQPTDGRVRGTLNARWTGMKQAQVQRSIDGTLSLELTEGTLTDTDLLRRLSKAVGITELKRLDVNSGRLEAIISNGELRITSQKFEGPQFDVDVTGRVNLLSGDVDLRCQLRLAPALLASLPGPLGFAALILPRTAPATQTSSADAKLTLPQINISGTIDNPIVRVAEPQLALGTSAPLETAPLAAQAATPDELPAACMQ